MTDFNTPNTTGDLNSPTKEGRTLAFGAMGCGAGAGEGAATEGVADGVGAAGGSTGLDRACIFEKNYRRVRHETSLFSWAIFTCT